MDHSMRYFSSYRTKGFLWDKEYSFIVHEVLHESWCKFLYSIAESIAKNIIIIFLCDRYRSGLVITEKGRKMSTKRARWFYKTSLSSILYF